MTNLTLPPLNTALLVFVDRDQGRITRLPPLPCARSLTYNELREHMLRRFALDEGAFDVEWVDDDNNLYVIEDDASLQDALDYFTPAALSSAASRSASSSSQSSQPASTPPAIEMHVRLRIQSRISLSEFAPSSRASSSSASDSGRTSYSVDHLSWDSGSGLLDSDDGEYSDLGYDDDDDDDFHRGDQKFASHDLTQTWAQVSKASSSPQSRGSLPSASSSYRDGSSRPPLNGRQRLAPHSSASDDDDDDDAGTEYAFSSPDSRSSHLCQEIRAVHAQVTSAGSQKCKDDASHSSRTLHHGITCIVCRMSPIFGTRYMCVMCPSGPSFCGRCEEAGRAILHTPHAASHAMLKLVEPLPAPSGTAGTETSISSAAPLSDNSVMATALITAAQTLSVRPQQRENTPTPPPESVRPLEHDVLCSFCSEDIGGGPRFLCANCPLDLPTPNSSQASDQSGSKSSSSSFADGSQSFHSASAGSPSIILTPHEGYNLCSTCEQCSLSVHDPNHFFIRIPSPAELVPVASTGAPSMTPLRLNPYLSIEHRKDGLLPELYRSDDSGWQEVNVRIQSTPLRPRSIHASPDGSASPGFVTPRSSSPLLLSAQAAATLRSRCEPPTRSSFRCSSRLFGRRRGGCGEQHQLEVLGSGNGASPSSQYDSRVPASQRERSERCVMDVRASTTAAKARANGSEGSASTPTSSNPWSVVNHEAEYVNSLIHPGLMCDMCFEPIEGCWLRCVNCTHSFDVCSECQVEAFALHDAHHSFALFKRSVDLDLFKSLVDHVESPQVAAWGSARAMVPFPLV